MDPNFIGHNLEKQNFGYAKKYVIWMGNFTFNHVAYVTVDFEKVVNELSHAGSNLRMFQEENEAIRKAPKRNNSLRTFPSVIKNHLARHQSTFKCPVKRLNDQCDGVI